VLHKQVTLLREKSFFTIAIKIIVGYRFNGNYIFMCGWKGVTDIMYIRRDIERVLLKATE